MSLQTKTTLSSACFCSRFLHGPEIPFASKGISVKHIYRCWRRKWKAPVLFWKPQSSQTKPTKRFSPYNTPPDLLSLRMWGLGTSTRPHLPLGVICISETKIPDGNRNSVHAGPKKKKKIKTWKNKNLFPIYLKSVCPIESGLKWGKKTNIEIKSSPCRLEIPGQPWEAVALPSSSSSLKLQNHGLQTHRSQFD